MKFTKAHIIYFSPTSTSKQVASSIVHGTGIENVSVTDLTHQSPAETEISSDTLVVIAVPVYGGHVAPLAFERLKSIQGNDTPAVLVTVYGNRAYEKALMELDMYATRHNFKVIAAATFVGEHTYSTERYPISPGRPDKDDLAFAEDFGKKIVEKILKATDAEKLYPVDVRTIKRPKQPFFFLLGFLREMIALRKSGIASPKVPATDADKCIHCGECVECCPNEAIVAGDELNTIAERCIKCCACVKGCPENARTLEVPIAPLLSKYFKREKCPQVLV
jgi:Dissimilatory sulfite reductase (desulfoviridin), alpha and beta subunits